MVERLKSLLRERGLTQREFATEIGISEITVSRYMHGVRSPSYSTMIAIARYFGVTIEYILGETDYKY